MTRRSDFISVSHLPAPLKHVTVWKNVIPKTESHIKERRYVSPERKLIDGVKAPKRNIRCSVQRGKIGFEV